MKVQKATSENVLEVMYLLQHCIEDFNKNSVYQWNVAYPDYNRLLVEVENNSLYNTPPVIPIFTAYQTLLWIKSMGGVEGMFKRNTEKADMLYNEIERNKLFRTTVAKEDRSIMNVCFVMNEEYKDLEADFATFSSAKGMLGIKGHRSVGGFRASLYNALELESVKALVEAMQEFEASH